MRSKAAIIAYVIGGMNMQDPINCHKTKAAGKPKPFVVKDLSLVSEETDPQGMYTGVPEELYEKPVQDADDL